MDGFLLATVACSASASAGVVLGYIHGKEEGRNSERQVQGKRSVDEYFASLPHGDPNHWCSPECYQFPKSWRRP